MPMFYTPKPRQFHYEPRFYDPEHERWEALKKKYADQQEKQAAAGEGGEASDEDLAYFEQRLKEIEGEEKRKRSKLGWKDMFRKREMPKFNYQPRFSGNGAADGAAGAAAQSGSVTEGAAANGETPASTQYHKRKIKIHRRFDMGDADYMQPVSGGRIMIYVLLVCLLLYWIIF